MTRVIGNRGTVAELSMKFFCVVINLPKAFADLLKKHHRPVGLQAALKASLRTLPANDQPQTRKRR